MLMIRPGCLISIRRRATRCESIIGAVRFTARVSSHASRLKLSARPVGETPRVVHQDVDVAESRRCLGHQAIEVSLARHVCADSDGLDAVRFRQLCRKVS